MLWKSWFYIQTLIGKFRSSCGGTWLHLMLARFLAGLTRGRRAPTKGFWSLTSKRGNKNFYKGKGSAPTGRHTKRGGYILIKTKLPLYMVPDLAGFNLKPYIARDMKVEPTS